MKRLTNTRFFLVLGKGIDDPSVLRREYDNFVTLLLSEGNTKADRMLHHNTLVYTRSELSGMTGVSGGDSGCLCL